MNLTNVVVEQINKFLGEKGMTQYQLAEKSGVPYPTIKSIMQKRTKSIDFKTLLLIIKGFGLKPSQFIDDNLFDADNLDLL